MREFQVKPYSECGLASAKNEKGYKLVFKSTWHVQRILKLELSHG